MISTSTVFIVGAGASADYGFPLGAALVEQIVRLTSKSDSELARAINLANHDPNLTGELANKLKYSDSNSIDTFLEGNRPEFVEIGKLAIAYVILMSEFGCKQNGRLIEKPPGDHWLKDLWNIIRPGSSIETLPRNSVSFLTFNYDRVLEHYFDTVIANTFNLDPAQATELRSQSFPIVHLHGALNNIEFGGWTERIPGHLTDVASGIRVVHDTVPSDDSNFQQAHELLDTATLVCCLGFGYDPVNMTRLGLTDRLSAKTPICGSTFGMGDAEIERVQSRLKTTLQHGGATLRCGAFLKKVPVLA